MSYERLTGRENDWTLKETRWLFDKMDKWIDELVDHLAAYEDSGLSPSEVAELARAKEDGGIVEPDEPCPDGVTYLDKVLIGGVEWNT